MTMEQWATLNTPSGAAPIPGSEAGSSMQASTSSLNAASASSHHTQSSESQIRIAQLTAGAKRLEFIERKGQNASFLQAADDQDE